MSDSPTVFIIDDDPAARESMAALVESNGLHSETFPSGEEFLEKFDSSRPGCIVTDFRMLGMSGLDLQQKLVEREITTPVILITGFANVPMAVQALQGGAVTVLEKPCPDDELFAHIRTSLELDAQQRLRFNEQFQIRERLALLTDRERKVMELLVEGLMNKVIAKRLDIGLRTVELRRHEIMRKMDVTSVAELVRLVVQLDKDRIGEETSGESE